MLITKFKRLNEMYNMEYQKNSDRNGKKKKTEKLCRKRQTPHISCDLRIFSVQKRIVTHQFRVGRIICRHSHWMKTKTRMKRLSGSLVILFYSSFSFIVSALINIIQRTNGCCPILIHSSAKWKLDMRQLYIKSW